ncbi:MAG: hypothetical protein ACK5ME_00325 [Parahaliea sp.]
MEQFLQITDWADRFTIWAATFALVFSLFNWWQGRKLKQDIKIIIQHGNSTTVIAPTVKRIHCTRAEIFGLLRSVSSSDKFSIPFLGQLEFYKRLNNVQNAKSDELIIEVNNIEEFNKFAGPTQ